MPWRIPYCIPWSDSIKKRACRYLLQRYLGQFLEEKLTLDQLTVDLYNGTGTVRDVSLDVQALNELGEQQNIPVEFVDGYISVVSVSIPWSSVLKDASYVEVTGLFLTVQPKKRADCGASMFESMWNSMSTSMQLAQECLKQDNEEGKDSDQAQPLDGLELFAQTIDSILCRVKVKFIDTVIRVEYVPKESNSGVALEVKIKNMDYFDEAGLDTEGPPEPSDPSQQQQKIFEVAAFTSKKFCMEGVTLFTDEFPFHARTFSRSLMSTSGSGSTLESKNSEDVSPVTPSEEGVPKASNLTTTPYPVVFAQLHGRQEFRVKMKQNESIQGPKVDLEVNFGSVAVFLSPRQVHTLMELMKGLSSPDSLDNSNVCPRSRCAEKPMEASDFQRVERDLQQQLRLFPMAQGTGLQFSKGWSTSPLDSDEEFLPMQGKNELSESVISNVASMETSMSSNMSSSSYASRQHGFSGLISPDGPGSDSSAHKSSGRRSNSAGGIGESWGETTRFQLRASSVVAILLHEDILTVSVMDGDVFGKKFSFGSCVQGGLASSSLLQMKEAAQQYFKIMTQFANSGKMESDLLSDKEIFLEACPLSHLRLVICPLVIEGKEKTTPLVSVVQVSVTAANLSFRECLIERAADSQAPSVEYVEILRFAQGAGVSSPSRLTSGLPPNLRAYYRCSERGAGSGHSRRYSHPCSSLTINLQPCNVELDISIVDRITAILNPQPLCQKTANKFGFNVGQTFMNQQSCFYQAVENPFTQDYKLEIKVSCPLLTVKTRFPIPDLRPIHEMDRPPWWKRSVRKDVMILELTDASLRTVLDSREPFSRYELQSSEIQGSFSETDTDTPVPFIRSFAQTKADGDVQDPGEGFGWPRLVFTVHPVSKRRELEEPIGSLGMQESTIECSLEGSAKRDPSPFSSKKVIHESDTPHAKHKPPSASAGDAYHMPSHAYNSHQDESEELIIPGDKQEMSDFIDQASHNSRFKLDINLPCTTMQLSSKHFYEVLYNRINTDLMLWEPSAPSQSSVTSPPCGAADFQSTHPAFLQDDGYTFGACKSGSKNESDSDSDTDAVYHSVYENSQRQKKKLLLESKSNSFGQSNFVLSLNIGHGIIGLHTPVRDTAGNVIPNQHGEFDIVLEDGNLFAVSSYKSNPELGFVCIQVCKAALYHNGMVPTALDVIPPLPTMGPRRSSSHLRPTIYDSGPGASTAKSLATQWVRQMQQRSGGWTGGNTSRADMLSVAIRIHADPSTNLKNFRVAAGIRGATLRHYVTPSTSSWLTQLVDFFDVLDYPVAGCSPPRVVTELHLHLWDCAVDYRPLHIPLLSVITLGSFSVSSNMAAQTNTSTLRFIAEDAALFISDKVANEQPSVRRVKLQGDSVENTGFSYVGNIDLRRDYVCVIEMGLFELSLRLYEGPQTATPKVDLRASNNIVHLRTCADSGRALTELLTYFASDGDLAGVEGTASEASCSTSPHPSMESLSSDGNNPTMSRFRAEHVHDLMEEAMRDANIPNANGQPASSALDPTKKGVEVFFFPDEGIIPSLKGETEQKRADTTHKVPVFSGATDLGSLDGEYEGMDVTVPQCADDEDDEEFCILEDDPGTGIPSRTGEPEVRVLSREPIRVVDNHFYIPAGKADLLRAPSHYPAPVLRYALREMTLIWHLYGGHDFGVPEEEGSPRRIPSRQHGKEMREKSSERTSVGNKVRYSRNVSNPSYGLGSGGVLYYKSGNQEKLNSDGSLSGHGPQVVLPYSSSPSKSKLQQPPTWQAKGGPGRRHNILMELQLNKVRFQHEVYPDDTKEASRQVILVHDVEIRDRLATSEINKFLYQYSSETKPRQSHANMVVIKAVHIRPDPNLGVQECCLKISILPLRLNIDQDSLLFLHNFFCQLSGGSLKEEEVDRASPGLQAPNTPRHTPTHQVPVMVVNMEGTASGGTVCAAQEQSQALSSERRVQGEGQLGLQSKPLILLEEESHDTSTLEWESPKKSPAAVVRPKAKEGSLDLVSPILDDSEVAGSASPPIFFRNLIFSPDVPIRLDYHGKRVDMTHGPLAGLLMGLGQLNCSEIRLKRLSYRHGLLGFDKLLGYMLTEWLQDIKRNQLPSLLGGVGPMHSLVQLFQGIRDLFWMPIEQYQKDGRIVRGLQRGANSFTTSTAMAALELTSRLVNAIQSTAETAYDMVSPGPSVRRRLPGRKDCHRRYQPADIREGMANAYLLVKEGLGDTAQTIVRVASEEHENKGVTGAVGGVLRQIPPTVVRPLVLASQATSNVLGGMRSQLVPDARREDVQKWRPDDESL
ncbi:autophagy-related protein 2 homolog B isoform X2 [Ischnura elegans]|uniref:autophagy-related protein 2 homolog B isoform X2 n=1 Tax=Ischnura elegans TaxID=197161 RepID=UPI001ED88928|nr:autophagy-related protein 2 homolog B isoform X2 [Ischnura elegans]